MYIYIYIYTYIYIYIYIYAFVIRVIFTGPLESQSLQTDINLKCLKRRNSALRLL